MRSHAIALPGRIAALITLSEHLELDELAAKQVCEFAFVITPLELDGRDGLHGAPIATR